MAAPSAIVLILTAAASVAAAWVGLERVADRPDMVSLVALAPGSLAYRASGEFLADGVPVNAPLVPVAFARGIAVMTRQVSDAKYRRCVSAGACKPLENESADGIDTLPAVGVDLNDAIAYARWLSTVTGHRYRLPTDAEWAYAAGERFHDDALATDGDARDPAKRWLAAYESESAAGRSADPTPHPFGSFGPNRNGLFDIAGNVWEWTASCYVRHAAHTGASETEVENCGVHVVEGSHRTYLSDFIRNPRGGACSVGAPPSNLGIRLVRDDDPRMIAPLVGLARRMGLWR